MTPSLAWLRIFSARMLREMDGSAELPFTGHVERRDPATYQQPSEVLICRCSVCRGWTLKAKSHCSLCHNPLVPHTYPY